MLLYLKSGEGSSQRTSQSQEWGVCHKGEGTAHLVPSWMLTDMARFSYQGRESVCDHKFECVPNEDRGCPDDPDGPWWQGKESGLII